jgi:HK97 family phage portal protein
MAEKKNLFQRMFGSNVIQTDIKQAGNMVGYFGVNSHSKEYKYADLANEGYKKNAIVYRCVNEISKGASSVDYLLKSGDDVIEQHPLINLMDRPNPLQSKSEFMNAMFGFLLLSGNAYVLKVGSEIGKPRELHLLRPDRVVIQGGNKSIPQRYDYVINGKVQQSFKVDPNTGFSELKHIKLWNPLDDYYGCSPLAAAAVEVDQHNLASQHNINLLNNGARPSGAVIFKPKDDGGFAINLSESQRQQLLTDLNNRFTGASNAGRPMLLEGDFDWKEMGLSPKDMDFINLKHMSATDIALCFGVPSQLVGVPDAQTYANVAEARLALYEETIIPHLKLVESDLNEWLVPMFDERLYLEFSTEEIPALAERKRKTYENITQAVNAGIMTRNEAREQIGLSPVDGGDEIYINASLFPLGSESPPEPDKPDNEVDLNEYEDVEEEEIDGEDKYDFWHDEKAIADIDFTPSDGMATEAKRGLKWREEYKRGGTRVGVTRANQLISKQKLSPSTVKRMYSFFSRHEVDKQGQGFKQGQEGYPSAGRIAWALWGGDAGFSWSTKKRNQIENESKAEADALKVGDMVSWDSSGGRARGKIKKIVRSGKLPVPDTNLTLNATEENPACLIEVYRGGEPSEIIVGHRFATLRKI